MNNSNSIIELRQANSTTFPGEGNKPQNGHFETVLARPVTVYDGDTITVGNSFIDTKAISNQQINITPELATISSRHFLYVHNWALNKTNYNNETVNDTVQPDGKKYIACKKTSAGTESRTLAYLVFEAQQGPGPNGDDYYRVKYIPLGKTEAEVKSVYVGDIVAPPLGRPLKVSFNLAAATPLTPASGGNDAVYFEDTGPGLGWEKPNKARLFYNGTYENVTINNFVRTHTDPLYSPIPFTFGPVTIPTGQYSPTELASTLTEAMTTAQDTYEQLGTRDILKHMPQFLESNNTALPLNNGAPVVPELVAEDGSVACQFDNNHDYFIGASKLAVEYSDITNSFKFTYMHTPVYDDGNEVVQMVQSKTQNGTGANSSKYIWANSNGGVVFEALEPAALWLDTLGFQPSMFVIPQYRNVEFYNLQPDGLAVVPTFLETNNPPNALISGVNTTSNVITLDTFVDKKKDGNLDPTWYTPGNTAPTTSELTHEIPALYRPDNRLSDAYYIIQLESNYFSNFVSNSSVGHGTTAIISRYQNYGNYTSGSSSDSGLVYTHSGAPITLSTLRVRVLNPDFSYPDDIGPDNTVFLNIQGGMSEQQRYALTNDTSSVTKAKA